MPLILSADIQSAYGDARTTLDALSLATVSSTDTVSPMLNQAPLPLLIQLGDTLCRRAQISAPQHIVFASSKGDTNQWCDSLLQGDSYAGGVSDIAAALAQHFHCPCIALSAACASGPAALGEAARMVSTLPTGSTVLVLAADAVGDFIQDGFAALGALDPSGSCHPFDANRAGLHLGEHIAGMLLCAADNSADSSHTHSLGGRPCHLHSWGASCDANHLTGPSRDGSGLALAIEQCCKRAPLPDAIIGHGTGTRYNDDSESYAYARTCPQIPVTGWKGLLGHSLASCGLTEAVLAAYIIANERPLPGTYGLQQAGTAAAIPVLAAGAHSGTWQHLLSANAGFGGFNAAILLSTTASPSASASHTKNAAHCTTHAFIDAQGRAHTYTGTRPQQPTTPAVSAWEKITAKNTLGHADASWGRMDTACRALCALGHALAHAQALPTHTAIILLTDHGCAETDRLFETGRREHVSNPQLFPYTLPSAPIGEASIRLKLQGPSCVLMHASDEDGRASAQRLLHASTPAVLLARIDCDQQPWVAWAELWEIPSASNASHV